MIFAAVCLIPITSTNAVAQVGGAVSIVSDDWFRGQTTSDGRPAATATVNYDDARGPYAGASVAVTVDHDVQPRLLRTIVYGGFAHRLGDQITLDVGLTHRSYTSAATVEYARTSTDFYAGAIGRRISGRVYVSPDYDTHRHSATYGEVDTLLLSGARWSLTSHAGILFPPRLGPIYQPKPTVDWRLGLVRSIKGINVSFDWRGATPKHRDHQWRNALVVGVNRSF